MPLHIEVLADLERLSTIEAAWESLTKENTTPLDGLDATNGPLWFATLMRVFAQARASRIVILREGADIVGLLPMYAEPGIRFCQRLVAVTELYGGRNGFLLARPDPLLLATLLRGASQAFGGWQSIRTMLVEGSVSARLLEQLVGSSGFRAVHDSGWESPYFPLLEDAKDFNAGMSKGLRQTIRTASNKLRPLGELRFIEISGPGDANQAMEAILEVERLSWKHAAGTAITCVPEQEAFYRALFPEALASGSVYGQVLTLNGKPIAFNFGLIRSGVYLCLKHSNTQEHQPLSPAQILNVNLVDRLRERGVSTYDYMGKSEPHKLRWSTQTAAYTRRPVWIYSDTTCGRVGHATHLAKRWLRHHLRKPRAVAGGVMSQEVV